MNSIVYVGMDVHKESYTIYCYSFDTDEDNSIKEYIRMRDDQKIKLTKQQILVFKVVII